MQVSLSTFGIVPQPHSVRGRSSSPSYSRPVSLCSNTVCCFHRLFSVILPLFSHSCFVHLCHSCSRSADILASTSLPIFASFIVPSSFSFMSRFDSFYVLLVRDSPLVSCGCFSRLFYIFMYDSMFYFFILNIDLVSVPLLSSSRPLHPLNQQCLRPSSDTTGDTRSALPSSPTSELNTSSLLQCALAANKLTSGIYRGNSEMGIT